MVFCRSVEKEEIRQALGVLSINTLSISIEGGHEIMGLFPQYAMLNHSCVHNTTTHILSDVDKGQFKVELKAKRKILKGEEITTRYLPILQGKYNNILVIQKVVRLDGVYYQLPVRFQVLLEMTR